MIQSTTSQTLFDAMVHRRVPDQPLVDWLVCGEPVGAPRESQVVDQASSAARDRPVPPNAVPPSVAARAATVRNWVENRSY